MHTGKHTHTDTHIHAHTHAHTCTHTHTHTQHTHTTHTYAHILMTWTKAILRNQVYAGLCMVKKQDYMIVKAWL